LLPPVHQHDAFTQYNSEKTQQPHFYQRITEISPNHAEKSHPSRNPYNRNQQPTEQQLGHSYGFYESSPTGELIYKKSSTIQLFPKRTVKLHTEDSSKKHVCDECGARFDRPNSLEVYSIIAKKIRSLILGSLCRHTCERTLAKS
jgi:hypothetical protein